MVVDPTKVFSFQLDDFQLSAIDAINRGKNVLVVAPTGSGKTAIAEYALHYALASGAKIFYTTPLKALSNQKFHQFGQLVGQEKVGLLTGDTQINRDAQVMILTTEIFRNILYKPQTDDILSGMRFLVLDECHYMQDADRGTVWEESIIYCPADAQILGLSATIGNPEALREWIESIHGSTVLIESHNRPVPLHFYFLGKDGLQSLLTPQGEMNRNLMKAGQATRPKNSRRSVDASSKLPSIRSTIGILAERDMLPVIYFLFSRRGCEAALRNMIKENINLLNIEESKLNRREIQAFALQNPWLLEHPHLEALKKGIAAHHAGLLPGLKTLVERLFHLNLLKVVFATETLAAGINMPARSVVISQISKRSDSGHRLLSGNEFMQMSGRAGRRGMDERGNVIVLESLYEGVLEVGQLAITKAEDLHSAFTPGYVMVLNLAGRFPWAKCRELVLLSYANFERRRAAKDLENTFNQLKAQVQTQGKSQKKERRLNTLKQEIDLQLSVPWPDFEATATVLRQFGYLTEDNCLTECGTWAADLRTDNILLLAELIKTGALDELKPYELAGFLCSLSSYTLRLDPARAEHNWAITESIELAARRTYAIIKEVSAAQTAAGLQNRTPFNTNLIEIGFDWASGSSWLDLTDKFVADEGDLVKCLRQAGDIAKQIVNCAGCSNSLREMAEHAYILIHRQPIQENLSEMDWA